MAEKTLSGRVAWVTGGATGMGRAIAIALAERGADVAIGSLAASSSMKPAPEQSVHLVTEQDLETTRQELASRGVRAIAHPLDVGDSESVLSFFNSVIDHYGKIDILVNAAGTSGRHLMVNFPDDLWDRLINVNLSGPFRTAKLCFPGMIERRWGRIINLASTAANIGAVAHGGYCASKAGLLGLTRCMALEGAPHGISCNAINPGYVATPQNAIGMLQQMRIDGLQMSLDDYRQMIADSLPQKRWIEATEIGALAAFLCRDEALGITGQDLTVSGGSPW